MSEKIQSQAEKTFWQSLETLPPGQTLALAAVLPRLRWNEDGLLPAIAQQHDTGEVLMLAWMNQAALRETLETGRVCYWSRSRQRLWRKGESSGQRQWLRGLAVDCDGDALLLQVAQEGPACHTGRRSCFYFQAADGHVRIATAPLKDPGSLYGEDSDKR